MKSLYIFNPDTDLALANNDPNFMAPKSARQLGSDLSLVPIWYAVDDSYVLVSSEDEKQYFYRLKEWFDLSVSLIESSDLDDLDVCELRPWGWNKALINAFAKTGNTKINAFNNVEVDAIRTLSSREWMSVLLSKFKPHALLCGESFVVKTLADLDSISSTLSRFLLKAPYSGSGRGLKWCRAGLDFAAKKWFNNTLRQQGVVIAEPIYNRVEDFAMEFEIKDEKTIVFIGFSSFKTDNNGVYQGNRFVSDIEFANYLDSTFFEQGFVMSIRTQLETLLLEIYGDGYRGVLGVDMMVCKSDGNLCYQLHPCVEVNLRMNMGVLAHQFYNRYVHPNSKGEFGVDFYRTVGKVLNKHHEYQKKYPLVLQEGKIVSGYLSLGAVTAETLCHAWAIVE